MDTVKRWALATTFLCFAAPGFAADSTITALPAGTALVGTEPLPMDQSGVTAKTTATAIKTFTSTAPTITGALTLNSGSLSAASWGITGLQLVSTTATLTDTSGAGTVASGADWGIAGNTIAATNARTLTDYYSVYVKQPIAGTNVALTNKWSLGLEGGLNIGGNARLWGDVTNTLTVRNSTNAQAFKAANTWTDTSNYEYGVFDWIATANTLTIGTTKAGTGSSRAVQFVMGGTSIFNINTSGHLLWNTDNTYDIGASGATRPRNVYVAGTGIFGGNLTVGNDIFVAGSVRGSGSTGGLRLTTDGVMSFDFISNTTPMFKLGGTTSSFPALKRSSTALQVRLADDSADTTIQASGGILTAAAPTVSASQIGYGGSTAAAANCNVTSPTPTGCIVVNVAGTTRYVPYY
jgi:hypothetical protein